MRAISNGDRMKIIKRKYNGETEENIAKWLFIGKSSVTKNGQGFKEQERVMGKRSRKEKKKMI